MRHSQLYRFLLLVLFAAILIPSSATHIQGGKILYKRLTALTVEFTFVGYRNASGVLFSQGRFNFGDGVIYGDDGDEPLPWNNITDIGNGIERWEFKLVHTYSSPGNHIVSYSEDFRSDGAMNMTGSRNMSFYIEAMVSMDPLFGTVNSSPTNYNDPDFIAFGGSRFTSNMAMFDEEGDSLSYQIVTPLKGQGEEVDGYHLPNDPDFYETYDNEIYFIDRLTGNLVWDVPTIFNPDNNSFFVFAIRTTEWRKFDGQYFKLGYTTLDYLIDVKVAETTHELIVPDNSCISEGDYNQQIVIQNPLSNEISINIFSEQDAVTFNGSEAVSWVDVIQSDEEIIIEVELKEEVQESGFHNVFVSAVGDYLIDGESIPIRLSKGFIIGINCVAEDLNVLSIEDSFLPSIRISVDQLRVTSQKREEAVIKIHNELGQLLFESPVQLVRGENTISYLFQTNRPYLITVENKKGAFVERVLLTK